MEKDITLCKYYIHNSCLKGNKCNFVHDFKAKPENVCKFYLAGSCTYGNKCRYDHLKRCSVLKPVQHHRIEAHPTTLTVLKPKSVVSDNSNMWIGAPVFVPGQKAHVTRDGGELWNELSKELKTEIAPLSYSSIVSFNILPTENDNTATCYKGDNKELLCPFAAVRECPFGNNCEYMHGDVCDMCGYQCLHPIDKNQRKEHIRLCITRHECEMEIAFATQRSQGVACSICLDVVKERSSPDNRMFGLLENCTHPFCLTCIRKWRCSYNQQQSVVRSCPICRVLSWFVIPSEFWIEDKEEKEVLISNYKTYLSTISCRNFDHGRGSCQFGTSCFYKHALPDGSIDKSKPTIRYREDAQGQSTAFTKVVLSQFFDAREGYPL